MKKVNALVLGLAVLLAFGCGGDEKKKEDPTPDNQVAVIKTCSIAKYHTFNYNSDYTYFYNTAGEVINVVRTSPTSWLNYSDSVHYDTKGNISRISRYEAGTGNLSEYTDFHYNTNNNVTERRRFLQTPPGGPIQAGDFTLFSYDGAGRLIKSSDYNTIQPNPFSETDYFYNADGSIRSEKYSVAIDQREVTEYTFDGNKNPWSEKKYNPNYWVSFKHNPIKIITTTYYGGVLRSTQNTHFSYTYNPNGYPTEMIGNNNPGYKETWTYNCQ